ncbi:MAG TPA: DUF692 family protein [Anaerolineae bacterium]|nr:DUF692 family protein [Anaerolineae bacterium]
MNFAVNYSQASARLLREGRIQMERFKCPAWPETIAEAQAQHPIYVHFPLRVGQGVGDAQDTETDARPDWDKFAALLAQTDSPWINLHLGASPEDHPDIPALSVAPEHVARVGDALIRDVAAVVARFGPERVVVENIFGYYGRHLRAAVLPETIRRVVEETGCGFLCDLSHARLAAEELGMTEQAYIGALPLARLREMHITGVQTFDAAWQECLRRGGIDESTVSRLAGRAIDHMPMTDADWDSFTWALAQIRAGGWATPGLVAFECGGIGGFYEVVMDEATLEEQAGRMYEMIKKSCQSC